MRVLFYIEPYIPWDSPHALTAHFLWADLLRDVYGSELNLGLISNPVICDNWEEKFSAPAYRIDPYKILKPHGWDRIQYLKSLYDVREPLNFWLQRTLLRRKAPHYLVNSIEKAIESFRPDLVIGTSQSALCARACKKTPYFFVEQAPLPRYGQPMRTAFDPFGHQSPSFPGNFAREIESADLEPSTLAAIGEHIAAWASSLQKSASGIEARQALSAIKEDKKIALFVMQPFDWGNFEGAYRRATRHPELICAWADQLPSGWVGVPTFHKHDYHPVSMHILNAISRSRGNVRCLPHALSFNVTEQLLGESDACVTISSTSAISAILLDKPAVILGKAPWTQWGRPRISQLNLPHKTPRDLGAKLFCAFTHKYCRTHEQIKTNPDWLKRIFDWRKNNLKSNADNLPHLNFSDFDIKAAEAQLVPVT